MWVKQSLIMGMQLEEFDHISMGGNPTIKIWLVSPLITVDLGKAM